jgi:hypothetical protein
MARVDDPFHYLDRAFEYYMTGRFAALNNLWLHRISFTMRSKCSLSFSCSDVFQTIVSWSK